MVLSASAVVSLERTGSSYHYLTRQALYAGIGIVFLFVLSRVNYRSLRKLAPFLLIITGVLLVLVLIPGIGVVVNGARRWIELGFIRFQPSELAKLAAILYAATYLATYKGSISELKDLMPPLLVACFLGLLVLLQPDMGTTGVVILSTMVIIFAAGAKIRHVAGITSVLAIGAYLAVSMESYRMDRMTAFIDPWQDPQGTGYQIIQSLIAFGSGGFFGVGLGMSRQKFSYLPESYTDFIFAVIGEELGLLGAGLVIALLAGLGYFGFRIALRAPDYFGKLLAGGLTGAIMLQSVINISAVTGIFPVTGVPLPFISAGGTALLLNMSAVGIILSVSRATKLGVVRERTPRGPAGERPSDKRPTNKRDNRR